MRASRPFNCVQFPLFVLALILLAPACVYRFANSERYLSPQPRTLFISSVIDTTSRAGQSARLMAALKRLLAQDRSFIITDLKTARWGLELQITAASRAITRVEKCDQGNEVLASGSANCAQIRANGKLPDISAEEEIAQITVQARAIDLETGAVLFQSNLPNLTTGPYPVVGDCSVRASLSNKQSLHTLRYLENSENASEALAQIAAQRIYEQLIGIPPPAPSY